VTTPDNLSPDLGETPYRPKPERPIGSVFADLADDLGKLFRLELALLRLELTEKAHRLSRGLTAVAIAGFLALSAWLVLLAAAVLGLSTILRPWLAALSVGVAALFIAGVLFFLGKRWLDAQKLVPRRTLNTLRENGVWIKNRVS